VKWLNLLEEAKPRIAIGSDDKEGTIIHKHYNGSNAALVMK
jgi:hypothetical protein